MNQNPVKERVARGEETIGCFVALESPRVAELLAYAGFDWLVIDSEHTGLDLGGVQELVVAVGGAGAVPLVRVGSAAALLIQRVLDVGAMGVVVPMIRTAAEAEAVVAATRFPPEGKRGFGPLRAARYSLDYEDYLRHANENIVVVLILETREALDDIERIASVPGIDALFFGLFDLCLALGLNPLDLPLPEVDAAIERVLAVGRQTGVAIGIGMSTPEELLRRREQGFRFLGYGPDYALLIEGARAGLAVLGREAPRRVARPEGGGR